MSGDIEAESPFFGEGGNVWSSHSCAMLVNAQQMRYRFGDLWIAVVRCWSNPNCDDSLTSPLRGPGRHRREMLVELRLECLLGDATRGEGALPAVGLQGAHFNLSRHQHAGT